MSIADLQKLESGATAAQAWELFDSLPAVRAEDLRGRWRGRELPTGHPMDGILEASGWYGKQFDDAESVHPLLFAIGGDPDSVFAVDPRRVPVGLADKVPPSLVAKGRGVLGVLRPGLRTRRHRARLRNLEHRGVVTAAMVYDHLPIIDVFRRVDETTLLGVMDRRGMPEPYFFVLARESA
ncbi:DUF4334 domain-containing protein [Sporichthya polymorpha]|uniref:DUF4334 domain-containing protein n=1 Tax=Sporichthya polymorpha TaxID=35751 RepID=UPI000370F8E7|nr:DUF4334 domain-containing protein [Sporichthya polymorpha]